MRSVNKLVLSGLCVFCVSCGPTVQSGTPKFEHTSLYDDLKFDESKRPAVPWKRNHVIVTFYFNQGEDLQRNLQWKRDDFDMIKPWHRSVEWNKLRGVVFYDSLSEEFINKYSNECIEFRKVKNKTKYQVTSERFLAVLDYLQDNPDIEYIFLTDASDVIVRRNPFMGLQPDTLYVGSEKDTVKSSWNWLLGHVRILLNGDERKISDYASKLGDNVLLNAGVSGGHRDIYMKFLESMKEAFEQSSTSLEASSDMAALNWVLYQPEFVSKIKTGYPIHSVFKVFDIKNQEVVFIHK